MIDNGVHYAVREQVNQIIAESEQLQETIRENTRKVIEELSAFNVFRKVDRWERSLGHSDSIGQGILDTEVRERQGLIGAKVNDLIEELGYDSVRDLIVSSVQGAFFAHEEDRDNG